MMGPYILKQSVPIRTWKQFILLNDYLKLKEYLYTPTNEIEVYIYNQNIKYIQQLKYQENDTFNIESIYKYIQKLNKLEQSSYLTRTEKSKIQFVSRLLNDLVEYAFIGDIYFPQVTMDTTYHRLYYHPIYKIPEKYIQNLITKFGFINPSYSVVKLDVNGALVRTVFQILYKITKKPLYHELSNTLNDIYEQIKSLSGVKYDRTCIKESIIKFINKGKVENIVEILGEDTVNDIQTYIHTNLNQVRKYMTIYSNKQLQTVQSLVKNSFFLYVNLDGGVLICKKPFSLDTKLKLPVKKTILQE